MRTNVVTKAGTIHSKSYAVNGHPSWKNSPGQAYDGNDSTYYGLLSYRSRAAKGWWQSIHEWPKPTYIQKVYYYARIGVCTSRALSRFQHYNIVFRVEIKANGVWATIYNSSPSYSFVHRGESDTKTTTNPKPDRWYWHTFRDTLIVEQENVTGIRVYMSADGTLAGVDLRLHEIQAYESLQALQMQEEYRKRDEQIRAEAARKVQQAREEADRKLAQARAEAEAKVQAAREEAGKKVKTVREEKASQFTSLTTQLNKALGIKNVPEKIAVETYIPEVTKKIQDITAEADQKVKTIRTQATQQTQTITNDYNAKVKALTAQYNQQLQKLKSLVESQSQTMAAYKKEISKFPILENKLKAISFKETVQPATDVESIAANYFYKKHKEQEKPEQKPFSLLPLGLGMIGMVAIRRNELTEAVKKLEKKKEKKKREKIAV